MGLIDVHHHIQPPAYVAAVGAAAIGGPAVGTDLAWGPERSIVAMDAYGIEAAVVSVSAPGVWTGDAAGTRALARACNEYGAQLAVDYPGRIGWLASLPLPDVTGTLNEIAHAFDVLGADGVLLMTNYQDRYLGAPDFSPVLAELDARGAVVKLHPTTCTCLDAVPEIPVSVIEFPHDTTRAVCSLLFSGALQRHPRIRWLLPHGGGTLVPLAHRIAGVVNLRPELRPCAPDGVVAALQGLYYDSAFSTNPVSFAGLRALVPRDHLLFGTDFPFAPETFMAASVAGLVEVAADPEELRAVQRHNAARLFPRFSKARET